MPRERLAEQAAMCATMGEHLYFDAIEQINDLLSEFFSVIDTARENGTMSWSEHADRGCRAGAHACEAIERIFTLRKGDRDLGEILSDIAKDMPEEPESEAAQ